MCLYDEESLVLGDVVLLGLFNKNSKEGIHQKDSIPCVLDELSLMWFFCLRPEMRNFKTAAKMMYGKFLVARATGSIAKEM